MKAQKKWNTIGIQIVFSQWDCTLKKASQPYDWDAFL